MNTFSLSFLLFLLLSFFLSSSCPAGDLVVLDRGYFQDLFRVTSAGQIDTITNGVPWERASSIAVDANGEYIVTVDIFDEFGVEDGVYRVMPNGDISAIAVGEPLHSPKGIAIDDAGNYIIVDKGYSSARIIQVTPQGATVVLYEGLPLISPTDVAIDASGHYIITDRATRGFVFGQPVWLMENGAVYRFDPIAQQLTTIRSSVGEDGTILWDDLLGHLAGIAIDGQGNFIISEPPAHLDDNGNPEIPIGNAYLDIMSPTGEMLDSIFIPDLDDLIALPLGIAIDENGDYLVADAIGITNESGRILRITPWGEISVIVTSDKFAGPGDVALLTPNENCFSGPVTLGPTTFTGTELYRSETTIETMGTTVVSNGANVAFEANNSIMLNSGFSVENGGTFAARIDTVVCPVAPEDASASQATRTRQVSGFTSNPTTIVRSSLPLHLHEHPLALRLQFPTLGVGPQDLTAINTSAEGDEVVFAAEAALAPQDDNALSDIYLYRTSEDSIQLLSRAWEGR